MQRDQRQWLWWVAVGLWVAVILTFSSDRFSAESTSRYLGPFLGWLLPAISAETRQSLLFLSRKGAHAFEYAVLAALAYRALRERLHPWRSAGFALALVAAVAVADETHQAFAAARTGSAVDVSIDVAAGATLLLLLVGVSRILQVRRPGGEVGG
jgi:VanZ family protein